MVGWVTKQVTGQEAMGIWRGIGIGAEQVDGKYNYPMGKCEEVKVVWFGLVTAWSSERVERGWQEMELRESDWRRGE